MQYQTTNEVEVHRPSAPERLRRRGRAPQKLTKPINLYEATPAAQPWQQHAVSVYHHVETREANGLEAELMRRIEALTGQRLAPKTILVSRSEHIAVATVDGVKFRLTHHRLAVVAACTRCRVGQFESPAIKTVRDLGYAISEWQPLCAHCSPEDSANWLDSAF